MSVDQLLSTPPIQFISAIRNFLRTTPFLQRKTNGGLADLQLWQKTTWGPLSLEMRAPRIYFLPAPPLVRKFWKFSVVFLGIRTNLETFDSVVASIVQIRGLLFIKPCYFVTFFLYILLHLSQFGTLSSHANFPHFSIINMKICKSILPSSQSLLLHLIK